MERGGVVAWHLSGRESFQLKGIMALDLDLDLDPGVRVYGGGAEGIDSYTMFSYLCVTNEGGGRRWWLVGWLVHERLGVFSPNLFKCLMMTKKNKILLMTCTYISFYMFLVVMLSVWESSF